MFLNKLKDHYRTLGVPENATEREIKLAYRRLAKRYHPDVNAGDKRAEERFKEVLEAYNVLSDAVLRSSYDKKRLFGSMSFSEAIYSYSPPAEEKKDPRRKQYSEEELQRARERHRTRTFSNMRRRKKILAGMIVTFILYLVGAAEFERWNEQQRQKENEEVVNEIKTHGVKAVNMAPDTISDLDSPYDSIFGPGVYDWHSHNRIVVYNPISDAVVCAVQADAPHLTIRNEFAHAGSSFTLNEMPVGTYYIKVYTGSNWNTKRNIPGGIPLGAFMNDEQFFRVAIPPIKFAQVGASAADTVVIDPRVMPLKPIPAATFFSNR